MLGRIKTLLGITDESKDALLNILMEDAVADALVLTAASIYDSRMDSVVSKMVCYNYNRLGQEGITSQSYSGASESYAEGYPVEILNLLKKFKKVKFQ